MLCTTKVLVCVSACLNACSVWVFLKMQKTQSKTQECNISNSRSSLMQRWKCAGLLHTCVDYLICCEENMSVQNSLPRCQSFLGGCKSNGDVFYRRKWGECFMHVHVDARMSCRSEQIPSSALLKMTRHCPALLKWICRSWDDDKTNIMPSAQKSPHFSLASSWAWLIADCCFT